jgi:hypothetical protein
LLQQPSGFSYVGVGLIEEAVKLSALWLLARHLPRYTARDMTLLLTGTAMQWTLIGAGEPQPVTSEQTHPYTAANWALLLLKGLVGVAILVVRWHQATAVPPMLMPPPVGRTEALRAGPPGLDVPA